MKPWWDSNECDLTLNNRHGLGPGTEVKIVIEMICLRSLDVSNFPKKSEILSMPNSYGLWSGTYHFLWGEHCDSLWITSCSCRGFAPGCVHCFEARSTSVDFKETVLAMDQKVPTCMIVLILWMVHDGSIVGRCCDETWWASQWPTSNLLGMDLEEFL